MELIKGLISTLLTIFGTFTFFVAWEHPEAHGVGVAAAFAGFILILIGAAVAVADA